MLDARGYLKLVSAFAYADDREVDKSLLRLAMRTIQNDTRYNVTRMENSNFDQ